MTPVPVPVPVPGAAMPDRPATGERALRRALGYIATAHAPGTRCVDAAEWQHLNVWCLRRSSSRS
jgi:hypothetical protein